MTKIHVFHIMSRSIKLGMTNLFTLARYFISHCWVRGPQLCTMLCISACQIVLRAATNYFPGRTFVTSGLNKQQFVNTT